MGPHSYLKLVEALAQIDSLRVVRQGEAVAFVHTASYDEENFLAFLPGFSIDGFPMIEFRTVLGQSSPRNSLPLHMLAFNLAERNFDTVDVIWMYVIGPAGEHAVVAGSRLHGGRLNQHSFRGVVQAMQRESAVVRRQFLSTTGELVAYPLGWRAAEVTLHDKDDVQDGRSDPNDTVLDWIMGFAAASGWQASMDEDGDRCIELTNRGVEVTVFVSWAEQSNGDAVIRFSSYDKELAHDTTILEDIAYKLMLRNAYTLHARWAIHRTEDSILAAIVANTTAREIDAMRVRDIVGSFVSEYHYASAELGGM
jgi:hypothetical protein